MSRPPPAPARGPLTLRDAIVLLRWPLAIVFVVALAVAALWRIVAAIESAGRATAELPSAAAEKLATLARGLWTGDVTERFLAAVPTVAPSAAGNLEVAVAESVETISRTDDRRALWDLVPLGSTTVELRVPVTYRYHVRLDEKWTVEIEEGFCRVRAPALRPSLPPALHTDRIERRTEADWLRFDAEEQLAALERRLTPELSRLAADPRHRALVREPARRAVARFVRAWLLTQDAWSPERVRAIQVVFADEPAERFDPPATLLLGD